MEIICFNLENDLDLVLAHQRSMQLAKLCGLNLVAQTSFATAVSEIARYMIERGKQSELSLSLDKSPSNRTAIFASISSSSINEIDLENENFKYAQKLVSHFDVSDSAVSICLVLPKSLQPNRAFVEKCRETFKTNQFVSPYEEVKRKNKELQQLADNLIDSESQYQELTNSIPLMMFTLSADNQMVYANEWFLKFNGISLERLKGTNWFDWIKLNHLDVDISYLIMKFEKEKPFQLEILLSANGDKMWHLLSLTPQSNSSGKLLQWFGFIVDIHAQKVVDQTLKDNQELIRIKEMMEVHQKQLDHTIEGLSRSNQELARYAYVASHDLQEPIRKVRLLADMLIERYRTQLPEEGVDLLTRLRNSAEQMQMVIKDLLTYSRLDNDTPSMKELVDLSTIVRLANENMAFNIQSRGAKVTVNNSVQLIGNTIQLLLLFQNLIANAIKFTQKNVKPVILIKTDILSHTQSRDMNLDESQQWACVQIIDNGIGFDQRYANQIFEVFQRLNSRNEYEGTGIGLSICKKIVELHGGLIKAQSSVGNGSIFTLYLPLQPTG